MWRYFVGVAAGVLLVLGGALLWRNAISAKRLLPDAPTAAFVAGEDGGAEDTPAPPQASEKTREQKRFSRYDHDKNGAVGRDEFLAARRRAFAKLDLNGDGTLSFDEYAAKSETRFASADADKSGALTAAEFAATRITRKAKASPRCPPAAEPASEQDG